MSKKTNLKKELEVILNNNKLSDQEIKLIEHAVNELGKNIFEEKVAQKLKTELSFLSMKHLLTDDGLKCLTYLSINYLGTGKKGMIYF